MALAETKIEPAKIKITKVLPNLKDAELGEMYLLIDGGSDDHKIHIRTVAGWKKSAALS